MSIHVPSPAQVLQSASLASVLGALGRQPGALYTAGRDLVAFHSSPHPRRLIRAPNQVGKTQAAAKEADWHMTGRHPYRVVPKVPNTGWILVADLEHSWPVISEKWWSVMCDHDDLDPRCRFIPDRGFYVGSERKILYRNGSRAEPRSGQHEVSALASATIDWLWIDEVPKRSHFGEALSRVAVKRGPVWMSCTPIGRPVDWLRLHIEGDPETDTPPTEEWLQFVPELSTANCWWRTEEDIEAQKASYTADEYAQRVYGAWEGVTTDRRFNGFTADSLVDEVPEGAYRFAICMDHGEGVGREFVLLLAIGAGRIYVIDEYVNATSTTPEDDAGQTLAMLGERGLGWSDVDEWTGDVNSAGKANGGGSVNAEMERAFARLTGHPTHQPPFRIGKPAKGKGSVEAGERLVNSALIRGELRVHRRCKALTKCLQHYRGEEDLKHGIDTLRYGAAPQIERWRGSGVGFVQLRGR